jgi:hypothetical protein
MMSPTGQQSKPSVKTPQLQTTLVSPDASLANIASRLLGLAIKMFGSNAGLQKLAHQMD